MERLKRKILRERARLAWWKKEREGLMAVAAKARAERPDTFAAPAFGVLALVAQAGVERAEDGLEDLEQEQEERAADAPPDDS